jgi:hypothetical protein
MSDSPEDRKSVKIELASAKAKAKALRPWYKKKRFIFPAVFVVLMIIGSATAGNKSSTNPGNTVASNTAAVASSVAPQSVTPVNWFPTGFHEWGADSNVAWRWNSSGSCKSGSDGGCYFATFISHTGCSNFYAAINLLDSSKAVVDYSNATLPTLQPLQQAKLEFSDVYGKSRSAEMSQITCG